MEWQHWLAIAVVLGLIIHTITSAWRRLRDSEKMLKNVDKSKLKNLGSDGWDDN